VERRRSLNELGWRLLQVGMGWHKVNRESQSAGGGITGGSEAERPENVRAHTYTQTPNTQTPNTQPRGLGWRIHCGIEVTVLSTNKQLSLSGVAAGRGSIVVAGRQAPPEERREVLSSAASAAKIDDWFFCRRLRKTLRPLTAHTFNGMCTGRGTQTAALWRREWRRRPQRLWPRWVVTMAWQRVGDVIRQKFQMSSPRKDSRHAVLNRS
jgi:hypothetical protein